MLTSNYNNYASMGLEDGFWLFINYATNIELELSSSGLKQTNQASLTTSKQQEHQNPNYAKHTLNQLFWRFKLRYTP